MAELLNSFFTNQFIPHGHCYLWQPGLVGLHILSDALIALAYYSIPLMLVYFVRKRQDLPFDWIFLMFGAFIIACGTTHVMEIWTLWHPTYWLSGSIKALTAFVSVVTAVELVPLIPLALALPSPAQLEAINNQLEERVNQRTAELAAANELKDELLVQEQTARQQVTNILESISDAFFALDNEWRFTYINYKAAQLLYKSKAELLGNNVWQEFSQEIDSKFYQEFHQAVEENVTVQFEAFYPPLNLWLEVRAYPAVNGLSVYFQDITVRKREQALLALQKCVLEKIATSALLPEVLNTLTKLIEEQLDGTICSILLLNEDKTKLFPVAGDSVPESYNQGLALGVPVGAGIGSCGTAAYTKKSAIADIASDPIWADFRDLALLSNLQTCWSTPLFASNGDVLGTLAVYYRTSRQPSEFDRQLIEVSTHLAEIAILRQRSEQALRFSEARLRRVVESNTIGIFFWDIDGNISDGNDAFLEIVGYTQQDLHSGKIDWQQMTPPEYCPSDERALAELRTKGIFSVYEKEYIRKDGSRVPILIAGTLLENFEDRGVAFVLDLSDRKQIEADLEQSNSILSAVLEGTTDAIFMKDLQGRYVFINSAGADVVGKSVAEIVGKDDTEIFPYEIGLAIRENERKFIASGVNQTYEDIISYRGELRTFLAGKTLCRNAKGDVIGIIGIARDISDRKRIEEQIKELNQDLERRVEKRTVQLEVANKELEAFSYSVSHDLRAPLRSIDGFSLALLESYGEQLDEKGKHYLQRVRNASQRMGELIDDLLLLARVTRSEMHFQTVNLSEIVQAIAADLQHAQPERSVDFIIAADVLVQGDFRLLKIVFENLLNNAWKFTSKKLYSTIEFGTSPQPDSTTVYFVRDNGAGFDMAYANNLFGAFQRLHTIDEFPGSGIGLATVKRIVHRHGGRIWAEGANDQGATFYFTLQN
jgi:PAS domain S-box-containing protein